MKSSNKCTIHHLFLFCGYFFCKTLTTVFPLTLLNPIIQSHNGVNSPLYKVAFLSLCIWIFSRYIWNIIWKLKTNLVRKQVHEFQNFFLPNCVGVNRTVNQNWYFHLEMAGESQDLSSILCCLQMVGQFLKNQDQLLGH